jgi:hypothetical protein
MSHIDFSNAYEEGFAAARRDNGACPYVKGTAKYEDWWKGYEDSLDDWEKAYVSD